MARTRKTNAGRPVEAYEHKDKQRVNNPPAGLVTPETDPDEGVQRTYAYDPHLDPQLQWAGKTEHTSFLVPTVSLHVHERIDPRTIIEAVRRTPDVAAPQQLGLFASERTEPLRHGQLCAAERLRRIRVRSGARADRLSPAAQRTVTSVPVRCSPSSG